MSIRLRQALDSLLRAERPDVEERRTQMLQLQGEQSVKVRPNELAVVLLNSLYILTVADARAVTGGLPVLIHNRNVEVLESTYPSCFLL